MPTEQPSRAAQRAILQRILRACARAAGADRGRAFRVCTIPIVPDWPGVGHRGCITLVLDDEERLRIAHYRSRCRRGATHAFAWESRHDTGQARCRRRHVSHHRRSTGPAGAPPGWVHIRRSDDVRSSVWCRAGIDILARYSGSGCHASLRRAFDFPGRRGLDHGDRGRRAVRRAFKSQRLRPHIASRHSVLDHRSSDT
jgi:hypothetical protein